MRSTTEPGPAKRERREQNCVKLESGSGSWSRTTRPPAGGGISVAGEPAGKRFYPLVRELTVSGIPGTVTCRILKLSRPPHHRWPVSPVTDCEAVEAHRANALLDAHPDDPEFGYRPLADEARDADESMADRTAWRIASANWWCSAFGKK